MRYYILVIALLLFLFFSNDFGLIDVQKTAIVMAAGIDREEDTFIVTSQIVIPKSSKQGQTESIQLVSRGKTVADAFKEINAKTGWYPKLVFCNLILLGEKTAESNVFDALDFFLRDEYLSDRCYVATCDGLAKDLLNSSAVAEPSGSVAMEKVLSDHAGRLGTVLPTSLKDFAIGYFSDSQSGFMPIIKPRPQQEEFGKSEQSGSSNSSQGQSSASSSSENESAQPKEKPVFSASETALFVGGKRVGTLNKEETFAFNTVNNALKLAPYSVAQGDETATLSVRQNDKKVTLKVSDNRRVSLQIKVELTAGLTDYSKAQNLNDVSDAGDVPQNLFRLAEKKLAAEITQTFEKCRAVECDLFGVLDRLEKYEKKHFHSLQNTALRGAILDLSVHFKGVR